MSLTKRVGIIAIIVVIVIGSFCLFDLYKIFDVKNVVLGYFQTNNDTVKISDFEYNINSLLFNNSGNNENEYFATINAEPIESFDSTKKYTVKINDILANRVYGDFNYINSNFTNKFYGINDSELLTDTLNIKVNFYNDGTKIILTTNNGEKAVKLWSSFIQKNGFNLKIVEDNYEPNIEADNLPTYTVNLFNENNELIDSYNLNALSEIPSLPEKIGLNCVEKWTDDVGNTYTVIPLNNVNLYATYYPVYTIYYHDENSKIIKTEDLYYDQFPNIKLTATPYRTDTDSPTTIIPGYIFEDGTYIESETDSDNVTNSIVRYNMNTFSDLHCYIYNPRKIYYNINISESLYEEYISLAAENLNTTTGLIQFNGSSLAHIYFNYKLENDTEIYTINLPIFQNIFTSYIVQSSNIINGNNSGNYKITEYSISNYYIDSNYSNAIIEIKDLSYDFHGKKIPYYSINLFNNYDDINNITWIKSGHEFFRKNTETGLFDPNDF